MDWPVLASLPLQEQRGLVARLQRRSYHRDEVIFHQGDPADTLHLIAVGHVSVSRSSGLETLSVRLPWSAVPMLGELQ
jgi:CRP-like cAMP-binding protein